MLSINDIYTDKPPLRWVQQTIKNPRKEVRTSDVIRNINYHLGLSVEEEKNPNTAMARNIIQDAPYFLCGTSETHRYGHAAWAFITLSHHEKAAQILAPIIFSSDVYPLDKTAFYCAILIRIHHGLANEAISLVFRASKWHNVRDDSDFQSLILLASRL